MHVGKTVSALARAGADRWKVTAVGPSVHDIDADLGQGSYLPRGDVDLGPAATTHSLAFAGHDRQAWDDS